MIKWVMLGLLGVLLISLVSGMLSGFRRGVIRTSVRTGTLLVFFILAVLFTPLVAKAFVGIKLPFLDGQSLGDYVTGKIAETGNVGESATTKLTTFADVIYGAPIVVINFIILMAMLYIFKWLSYIPYFIICKYIAPKYKERTVEKEVEIQTTDPDGTVNIEKQTEQQVERVKTERSRWWGLGVGAVQGIVMFFFFMLPVNGLIQMVDSIDSYKSFATTPNGIHAAAEENDGGVLDLSSLDDVWETVGDVNKKFQTSIYGGLTKYTGLQAMSGMWMDYLTTVKSVKLKSDVVKVTHLVKDVSAISQRLDGDDIIDVLKSLSDKDITDLKTIVDKAFSISIIKLALNNSVQIADFVDDAGLLNKLALFGEEIDDGTYNGDFKKALILAIKKVDTEFIKGDIKTVIDLAGIIFRDAGVNRVNLYDAFVELFDNISDVDKIWDTAGMLEATFTEQINAKSNIYRLIRTFFDLNVFTKIMGDEGTAPLYQIPISYFADFEREQIPVFDLSERNALGQEISDIMILFAKSIPGVTEITENDDAIAAVIDMDTDENGLLWNMGTLLNMLTNKNTIVSDFLRDLICDQLDKIDFSTTESLGDDKIDRLLTDLKDDLRPIKDGGDPDFNWISWLKSFHTMACIAGSIGDGVDPAAIGELLELAAEDDRLAGIVADIITELINNTFGNLLNISVAEGSEGDFIETLAGATDGIIDLINGSLNIGENAEDILTLFGGADTLLALANIGGITIEIDSSIADAVTIAIGENFTGEDYDKVMALFGLGS